MEIKIINQDDRMKVAEILVRNGYTVSQRKRQKTPTGKAYEYYLLAVEDEENTTISK